VGHLGGALSKNLLLKVCKLQMMDNYSVIMLTGTLSHLCSWLHALIFLISYLQDKKHRLYVVSALEGTKVEMKSRRIS
jgi:hypothetical protein